MTGTPHDRLIAFLAASGARFRIMEHAAEGRSEFVARIRGVSAAQGMKAIVLSLRGGGQGGEKRHAMAVIPGDRKLDVKALRAVLGAQKSAFADPEALAELTGGCVPGTVPPFSFRDDLPLVVDNAVRANAEVCFNAARLDRSVFMPITDYLAIAGARMADISLPPGADGA